MPETTKEDFRAAAAALEAAVEVQDKAQLVKAAADEALEKASVDQSQAVDALTNATVAVTEARANLGTVALNYSDNDPNT